MTQVFWRSVVEKQLDRVPEVIARKFRLWVALVEESGIREVRKHKWFRRVVERQTPWATLGSNSIGQGRTD